MKRILIAGIGNIFYGDDAFGVEVAQALAKREMQPGVKAVDFGIRSYDLAFAIADGYDAVVLVDAIPRGQPPGTLYLIKPDVDGLRLQDDVPVDAHSMDPVRVLQMASALGGPRPCLYLLGCEPRDVGSEEGQPGLSAEVQAAVPRAVERIESLVADLLNLETTNSAGSAPVERRQTDEKEWFENSHK